MIDVEEYIFNTVKTGKKEKAPLLLHELILKRIRLLAIMRVAWLRNIWKDVTERSNGNFDAHTEIDGLLYDMDVPSDETAWLESSKEMQLLISDLKQTEVLIFGDDTSRLSFIADIFGLNEVEQDVLHACFAIAIDPNLGRVFAYLHDHAGRNYVSETLIARLFRHGQTIMLHADSPLKLWGIIRETISSQAEPARLECDPFIKNWILGLNGIDEQLVGITSTSPADVEALMDWPVAQTVEYIKKMTAAGTRFRVVVSGHEGSGRKSFAAICLRAWGYPAMLINSDIITENKWQKTNMYVQRQAFLSAVTPVWTGEAIHERYWPAGILSWHVQIIISEPDQFIAPREGFADMRVELPVIPYKERISLWRKYMPVSATWPKDEMEEMALRHQSSIGQIMGVKKKMVNSIEEAYEALRTDSARRFGTLAQQMSSGFVWEDLVVPESIKDSLEDFIFEANERTRFWEQAAPQRLFPQGKSLIALFTGTPGTGKTMAAQVIANTLKLDLFRIDLSTMVSKYIGESAKNIERILTRAKGMDVVLFFDEADSLFGKRTEIKDSHDRYANTDTNYLLQAIENYPGIIILASNKKTNIDSGFTRRFRYLLDFPKPDTGQRLELWRRIIRELAGNVNAAALDIHLIKIASLMEITGAQIKLAVLSALFSAKKDKIDINVVHLLKGLERELVKEGKGISKQVYQNIISKI